MPIDLIVNGTRRRLEADPQRSLLTVLREDLDLTGAKYGCGEGQCGACTVLIEGQPTRSCLTKVASVAGRPIITIAGSASARPSASTHTARSPSVLTAWWTAWSEAISPCANSLRRRRTAGPDRHGRTR